MTETERKALVAPTCEAVMDWSKPDEITAEINLPYPIYVVRPQGDSTHHLRPRVTYAEAIEQ